ncbi:zinc finger protein OZF-like [Ostrinia nubilalis]|uniref:zinc finger protein OZF-like n=1 Tax=Ostrinia nubilalis TaxID=29057 RepID=UPI0030824C70
MMEIIELLNTVDICRFCLCVSVQRMVPLSDEILQSISSCFSLQINIDISLPQQVCDNCNSKITLISEFRKSVLENEQMLYKKLTEGQDELNKFYLTYQQVKTEDNEKIIIKSETVNSIEDDGYFPEVDVKELIVNDHISSENDQKEAHTNEPFSNSFETDIIVDIKEEKDPEYPEEQVDTHNSINNTNNTVPQLQCLTCFEKFQSQCNLLGHYNTVHLNKPKENSPTVTFEIETKSDSTVYKCNVCSKEYDTQAKIRRHVSSHSKARSFLCKLCGRTYKTASEIVRHGRAHNGTALFCRKNCGFSTAYPGALKEHERRHVGDFKYKCEKCGKRFQVKTWYLQHQNVHLGHKPYVCHLCGLAFHMQRTLSVHCTAMHPQSSSVKRYVCVHCFLPCDSRKSLTEHMKGHGLTAEKKFLCDLCGKVLANGDQLRLHKRGHYGVKPYTCGTCNKSFAKKFNLQVHQNSHSSDKAHECGSCGRQFSQRSALRRHCARYHHLEPDTSSSGTSSDTALPAE